VRNNERERSERINKIRTFKKEKRHKRRTFQSEIPAFYGAA